MHLRLDHEDDRVVPERGVRPDELVQVRVTRDRNAVIRLGPCLPVTGEFMAGQAGDGEALHVDARIDDESGAENDAVDRALDAVAVTIECSRISRMSSVTSSTFGRRNIGYHSLDISTRLQPIV